MSWLYPIKRSIRNLKNWLPVILKDEQYDYAYTYIVLHKKLELQEAFFRSDKTSIMDAIEMADEIKPVKEALARLIEDDYLPDAFVNRVSQYDWKDVTEKLVREYEAELTQLDKQKEQDKELVFNTMRDQIEGWWD